MPSSYLESGGGRDVLFLIPRLRNLERKETITDVLIVRISDRRLVGQCKGVGVFIRYENDELISDFGQVSVRAVTTRAGGQR